MQKIKICFILSNLPQGGAERQTLNLINNLDSNVYDITLLLYSSYEVFYKEVFDLEIKIIERKHKFKSKIIRNFYNALFLWFYLRFNNFDILHTLLFHNGFWVRLLAPSSYNNKIVYSVRNSLENANPFFLKFEKKFFKTSIVITNSLKSKHQFLKLISEQNDDRVLNIYNGINIPKVKEKNINKKFVIGTVGRQTKQKNQIQILRVINKLRHRYDLSCFVIGKDGLDQSNNIREYISQNDLEDIVKVMDSKNNIQEYYDQFDVFILSSFYEGCPNVLFEARASNVLVICSNGANSDDFIINGVNGFVYDGSDQDLERILTQVLEIKDTFKLNEIRKAGRDYVISKLSTEVMVEKYKKVYSNIMNKFQN
jgi:glycosyltransferase involved in cell wall biosynthesis